MQQVRPLNRQEAKRHRQKFCAFKYSLQFNILVLHEETDPGQLELLI